MREIKFRAWDGDTGKGYKMHGYTYRKVPYHPCATARGYVLEHRLVVEKAIGGYLPKEAVIHHLNGERSDNQIGNLMYISEQSRHAKEHDKGERNPNGQFVAESKDFQSKKFRLLDKNTGLMQVFSLQKLISTTFRKSQFEYRGEFTGLKDKNGVELYEGDIFKSEIHNPQNFHVEFVEGAWCATSPSVEGYPTEMNHFSLDSIEVIGNIHENPELLEAAA